MCAAILSRVPCVSGFVHSCRCLYSNLFPSYRRWGAKGWLRRLHSNEANGFHQGLTKFFRQKQTCDLGVMPTQGVSGVWSWCHQTGLLRFKLEHFLQPAYPSRVHSLLWCEDHLDLKKICSRSITFKIWVVTGPVLGVHRFRALCMFDKHQSGRVRFVAVDVCIYMYDIAFEETALIHNTSQESFAMEIIHCEPGTVMKSEDCLHVEEVLAHSVFLLTDP